MIIKINKVKVKLAYPVDQILKERFADGVRNTNLGRELSRLNIESLMLKFVDFRKRALLWEERERKEVKHKTKASTDEMTSSTVWQLIKEQQKQMEDLKKLVTSLKDTSIEWFVCCFKDCFFDSLTMKTCHLIPRS
jgi:hypothetical protein